MKLEHIHCIGIGGIGVSALARLYQSRGFSVSGSDAAKSEITDALRGEGIRVSIGPHRGANLPSGTALVVHTAAARPDNPELAAARRRRIDVRTYAEALGGISQDYRLIAVAGSHGKSTTTALVALALIKGGLDPTVVIGTKLREFKNLNFRAGRSKWLVIEADEYRASFLNYRPTIAVITNVDREHLDFYKSIPRIEAAFFKFLQRLRPRGIAVLNAGERRLRRIARLLRKRRPDANILWYSAKSPAAKRIKKVIRVPGMHNVSNAAAAYAVGRLLKIPEKKILAAIGAYRGAWRRFDYRGKLSLRGASPRPELGTRAGQALRGASGQAGAKVFADYAHHPTEIRATLQAAREKFPKSRIWCVFQPHHYKRLRALFPEFSRAFGDCDALILLDVYEVTGREQRGRVGDADSERLARAVSRKGTPTLYLADPARLRPFLKIWLRPDDVLLMMGAGDIWEMTKKLMK